MAPLGMLTLVTLASAVAAIPRPCKSPLGQILSNGADNEGGDSDAANAANATTITISIPTVVPTITSTLEIPKVHNEATQSGFESYPSATPLPTPVLGIESTETGWETGPPPTGSPPPYPPQSTPLQPMSTPPDILIATATGRPTLVTIVTQISNPNPASEPNAPAPGEEGQHTGGGSPGEGHSVTVPAATVPQTTGGAELLSEIIFHITEAPQPGVQPTPPQATPTDGSPSPAVIGMVGNTVTVGDATLTLTPGLSTTLGSTVVAITTSLSGETIIVVSSSGTAVTATITQTADGTGSDFGAAVTEVARPGDSTLLSIGNAAPSASSKAGSSTQWKREVGWWISVVAGIGVLF
jgi:hypothetical protein